MTEPAANPSPADRAKARLERMFGRPVVVKPIDGVKPRLPGEPAPKRPFLGAIRQFASVAMCLVVMSGAMNLAEYGPRMAGSQGYTSWSSTGYGAQLQGWQQTIAQQPAAVQVTILDVDRYIAQDGDRVNMTALARNQMHEQMGYLSRIKTEVVSMRFDLAEGQATQVAAAHCAMGLLPSWHERLSSAVPAERMRPLEQILHKTCGVALFFNLGTGEDIARSQSFSADPRYGARYVLSPMSFQDFVIAHELGHTLDFNLGGFGGDHGHDHNMTLEQRRAFAHEHFESADPEKQATQAETLYQTMRGESFADGVGLIAHMQKHGSGAGLYQLMAASRTISSWHARDLSHYTVPVLRAAWQVGQELEASGELKSMSLTDIARAVQDRAMPAAPDRAAFADLVKALGTFQPAAEATGPVHISYDSDPVRADAIVARLQAANPAAAANPYLAAFIRDYAETKRDLFVPYESLPAAQRYPAQLATLIAQRGDTPLLRQAILDAQRNELNRLEGAASMVAYYTPAAAADAAILAERRAALARLNQGHAPAPARDAAPAVPPAPNGLKM